MADLEGLEAKASQPIEDLTGSTVGRFAVRVRLGGGGMGEVYRADDTKLKRPVALKRVAPELRADERYRRRFLHEAERASALNDPHVAAVYDVLEQNGELFLVMEHVEGQTLRCRLTSKALGLPELVAIATQCAEGLAAAASKRIVHHDIKPENIMLTPAGQAKILDFGVAKRALQDDEGTTTTSTESTIGGLSGTVAYMAPEVLLQQGVDTRSDIFSLGIVLYEAVTGQHPFRAETFIATSDRILHELPVPPSRLNPHVPVELERIVTKMLAKDPRERYATAADLVVDLHALDRSLSRPEEYPAQIPSRARRWKPYIRPAVFITALLATALLLVPSTRQRLERWLGVGGLPEQKHLVVLPFANVGGDPANQAFCDGLTYTLTSKLTQLEQFHGSLLVVPASEVIESDVRRVEEAARQFGVSLALTGSVQRTGDSVLLSVNLVDARTRRQLRSLTVEAVADDPALLQGGLALRVAGLLELELQDREQEVLAAGQTGVVQARDFYLQGRGYLQRYEHPVNIDHAITEFLQALELDQEYALAYAGLGQAYWKKYEDTRNAAWIESARQACRQALDLDDSLAAPHICLGTLFNGTGQYEEAVLEFQRALEREPSSDDAYRGLAAAYTAQARLDNAEATYKKAISLRPGYWGSHQDLGRFYYRHGRYQEAEPEFRRVIELTPDNVRGYYSLGALYHLMGRTDEAIALLEHSLALVPTYFAYTNLGTLYFFQGHYAKAVPMFEKAVELAPNDYISLGNLADAYRWAPGQAGKARPAYQRAIELAQEQAQVNPRDPQIHSDLAVYWAKLGQTDKALSAIELARREAPDDVNILFKSVVVYHLAGRRQRAVEALLQSMQAGYSLAEIQADPELAELRQDPKFQTLIPGN